MDPWIHGSAAGTAARAAAAGAASGALASAATVCTYYVIIGGALRALLYLHDKVHTIAAEAAAPAADPSIHGSISFTTNHIFYYEMKNIYCLSVIQCVGLQVGVYHCELFVCHFS